MKYFLCLVVCVVAAVPAKTQDLSSRDSVQIFSMIQDWNNAWETRDYLLASEWYSNDARFTNAFGDKRNGKQEIEELLKHVFSLNFVMSGQSESIEHRTQVLSDRIVIVHSAVIRKGQKMPDETVMPDRMTTHLRVFQKKEEEWRIVSHLISDAREKQAPAD